MRFNLLFWLIFLQINLIEAQNIPQNPNKTDSKGFRQGKWTVLLDVFDRPTNDPKMLYQYLTLNYKDDKPSGLVSMYNLENQLVAEFNLIADRPILKIDGLMQYYYFNTNVKRSLKEHRILYDKGKKIRKEYDISGFEPINYDEKFWQEMKAKAAKIPQNPNKIDAIGKRQGKWTVWLGFRDNNYVLVEDPEFLEYYLLIEYLNDKPVGKVQKYNLENKLDEEFVLLADRPYLIRNGLATSYYGDGKVTELYEQGEVLERTIYSKDGTIKEVIKHDWLYEMQEAITQDMDANHTVALKYFIKAKQKADKANVPHNFDYAILCNNLAFAYKRQDENAKALALFLEAKEIFKKDKNSSEYLMVCENISNFYELQGKYQLAIDNWMEARSENIGFSMDLARLYFKMGKQAQTDSLVKQVEKYYENDLQAIENFSADYASNLLYWYESIDLASKSAIFRQKILDKVGKKFGKTSLDYGIALNSLGYDYHGQGDYPRALDYYLQAIKVKENLAEVDSASLAATYTNIGVTYRKLNQIPQALNYLEKAKTIYSKHCDTKYAKIANPADIFVDACRSLATNYHNLGFAYLFKPDFPQAYFYLSEAAAIRKHLYGEKSVTYAISCEGLAHYHLLQNQADSTLFYAQIATRIYETNAGNLSIGYAEGNDRVGDVYYWKKDFGQAYQIFREGSQIFLNDIQQNFSNLSEKEQKLYYQQFNQIFEKYVAFTADVYPSIPESLSWAYDNTLITKGLLFQSSEKVRRSILNSGDKILVEKYLAWKQKKDFLAKVVQMNPNEKQKNGINEKQLTDEVNQVAKELAQKSLLFANTSNKAKITWQDIQKQLKTNEIAIEIIRFRTFEKDFTNTVKYIVLIIQATSKLPEVVILDNGNELEKKYLNYYRNSIQAKKEDKFSYHQFWAKIQEKLPPNTQKIYLSIDGVYNALNINTLRNPETKKYLNELYDIQLLSNTRDLVTYAKNPKAIQQNFKNYQIHLFGYPDYSNEFKQPISPSERGQGIKLDTTQRFLGMDGKIAVLAGTKTEVENISQLFKNQQINPRIYLEKEATEQELKKLKNPNILHIATHGFFLADLPESSDNERGFNGIDNQKLVENPLLRCGLLLANAEQGLKIGEVEGLENGVLTAQEVMNLNLDNTDLVVMSACETGLGEISNGEGVYGLQRAFQQAGAKSVLMSLWTVSDEATQQLMTLFYENWITKQMPKRQAFSEAQKQLRAKFPEPYYWGAFVMVGE